MSTTPLKDAKEAGVKCIGIGGGVSRVPTQYEVDNEAAKLPTAEDIILAERQLMVVTSWQFKKALTRLNSKRGQVNAFVSNPSTGDATADQDIKDGWESAGTYERMNATVLYIQSRLDWTDESVDELFTLAATL